jgi:hypothetical protein
MGCIFPKPARSHFHLFGAVRDAFSVKRLGNDGMVVEEVDKWLRIQSENW